MEEIKIATLKGEVRGFAGKKYGPESVTRSISPANVYLKVLVIYNRSDKTKNFVGATFDPYNEKDMKEFYKKYPVIYTDLIEHKIFEDHPVNEAGEFELKAPVSEDWAYIVCARIENKTYVQLDEKGEPKYIGIEEASKKDFTIDDIVIPVKDKWWSVSKGTKKGDPKTDVKTVPPGVIPEDRVSEIEDKLKKGEYKI